MRRAIVLANVAAVLGLSSPALAQRLENPSGPVLHAAARAVFPEQVGDLRRVDVRQYDGAGRDISASYHQRRDQGILNLTVFIYPAPPAASAAERAERCRQERDANLRDVGQMPQYSDVEGGAEDGAPPPVSGVPAELMHRARFRFTLTYPSGRQGQVASEYDLYCYAGGPWFVKYRGTAPVGYPIADAVRNLVSTGPWPGRAARPVISARAD